VYLLDIARDIHAHRDQVVSGRCCVPSMVSRTLQHLEAYRAHAMRSVFENTTVCAAMPHIVGTCMQTFLALSLQLEVSRHGLPFLELAHVVQ